MDKNNNVSEKGQIVTASLVSKSAIACGVFPVWNGQYLPKVVYGRNHGEAATGSWEWSKAVRSV